MTDKKPRGRPAKAELTIAERRARRGATGGIKQKLAIPDNLRNDRDNVYRFVNDVQNRIHDMMNNDTWDMVDSDGSNVGINKGKALQHYVGTADNGDPLTAYLMKKPRAFYNEDKASEQTGLDEKMNQIRAGAKGIQDPKLAGKVYDTDEGIKL